MQHPNTEAARAFLDSVVLVMIVRGESTIIDRCLGSVFDQGIRKVFVLETNGRGYTDDRPHPTGARVFWRGLPGKVWDSESPKDSVGFGAARKLSLDYARQEYPEAEWALLLDADHELKGDLSELARLAQPAFEGVDVVMIEQKDRALTYANIRMVKLAPARECKGRTHEVWQELGARYHCPPELVWIQDHCDGSNRGEKYARDEALLRMDLEDNPRDERTVFYLAQTLDNMSASVEHASKLDEAIELYSKRAGMGGYADETWMARYRAGLCLVRRGKWNEGIGCLFDAWTRKPDRIEPLHRIARYYRQQNNFRAAFELAHFYQNVPAPASGLFVESGVYDHGADDLIATCAYQLGRTQDGADAAERLIRSHITNKGKSLELASWYLPILGGVQLAHYPPQVDGVWSASNPSFYGKGINVRLVNYEQTNGRVYKSRDKDKRIRSRNVILLEDGPPYEWTYMLDGAEKNHEIQGLEDVRFFGTHFTATCCEVPGQEGRPQVVIGTLDLKAKHARVYPIKYEGAQRFEKNWVIIGYSETYLYVLYSVNPTVVLRVSPTGHVFESKTQEGPLAAGLFRNSTTPITWHDGNLLLLVHDVGRREKQNVYMHRWVLLDRSSYQVLKWSRPFAFAHVGIEYACGLRWRGAELEVAFGFEDREARTVCFPGSVVELTESA